MTAGHVCKRWKLETEDDLDGDVKREEERRKGGARMCLCRCRVCCTWDAEYCIRTATTTTTAGFLHFLVGVLENIFFPVILLAVVMADQRVRERMYVGMRKWFSKNAARCSRGNKTPAFDNDSGNGDDGERGRY